MCTRRGEIEKRVDMMKVGKKGTEKRKLAMVTDGTRVRQRVTRRLELGCRVVLKERCR